MKYRKKPVVIEAIHFRGVYDDEISNFIGDSSHSWSPGEGLSLGTLEGPLHVSRYDWIIRGVQGELYPCKPDIFDSTYEPVDG